ncbi:HTTM domain-containing protein [Winogradskyella sp.]|uniref:HTTM domain-containing protein n=1 Tax=Winogradskyella sp. TaxID=1883156 RepID=UPI0025F80608|nr:HTTM domain-containing protein [Winogradskyella sp.]MBT8243895.1 HTTM domain-containing protein [Winogradskyella sp.]
MFKKLASYNRFEYYSPYLRIFVCLYLLKDIVTMWEFNGIIYESNSFLIPEISPYLNFFSIDILFFREYFYVFYSIYILLIFLFLFGIGKRITPLLLFLSLGVIQTLSWLTLNGGDNILKFIILYFVFIDSYSKFSLFKNKKSKNKKLSNLLSNLGGYSLCFHFCLIYFISAIHKIHADVWFNGIATYYILASERFQGTFLNTSLVQNGFFVTITTYGTIIIELFFPFLVWNKNLKFYMLFLAFSLHLGIAIFMMLYDFQILFIMILGFFISNEEWKQIMEKTKFLFAKVKTKFTN